MEDGLKKIEPTQRIYFTSKDYPTRPKAKDSDDSKDSKEKNSNENGESSSKFKEMINEETEKLNNHKKQNMPTEDAKKHMEGNSQSDLYRLMAIMNSDTEGAIRYLAELAKKNAKTTKPRREKDDVYNR